MINRLFHSLEKLAKLDLFFGLLFWLMILLLIGTIAQKEMGIHEVQLRYFSSWFFFLGPLPLPGAKPVLGLIILGLFAQLLFKTNFRSLKKMGVAIAHLGALLLLLGASLSSYYSLEGTMVLAEGQASNYMLDYHELELAITEKESHSAPLIFADNFLRPGAILKNERLPFSLKLTHYFKNSSVVAKAASGQSNPQIGLAGLFDLKEEKPKLEDDENLAALNFEIEEDPLHSRYSLIQNMPVLQSLNYAGKSYQIELRNKRILLPFSIQLLKFERSYHPGTEVPKSYRSMVLLSDGPIKQKSVIQMNEPLRYKGYTFYQAAFTEGQSGEETNLAVVKNVGRVFPYISSIIICLGLFIHLLMHSPKLFRVYKKK